MGVGASKQLALTSAKFPESERYYGLENFGNTCYANSVLQALYFCKPLRQRAIEHSVARRPTTVPTSEGEDEDETLLEALCDLFREISTQKKRVGVIPPRRFMQRLRADNQVFNSFMHQDAHELLNYLLNEVADILEKRNKQAAEPAVEDAADPNADAAGACAASTASIAGVGSTPNRSAAKRGIAGGSSSSSSEYACKTWIHSIFEGLLVNETRCLSCDKEAHKRMRIKRLPNVLALHLKRFKYFEQHQRFKKLSYRVDFPFELPMPHEVCVGGARGASAEPERLYRLFAVIVHAGSGPNHGHYVALVRSHQHWVCFDDVDVSLVDEAQVQTYFGSSQDTIGATETGYLLFYEAVEWDSSGDPPASVPPGG
ncbi:hypothetical protein Ctob_005808 [Chrysochromulina tobinii]|uniref:ubiquitinyl hydrolase 1 n=1 Tax=Chrysochromulina tobinii TaxID=1460289 RepID=A0A0M0JYU3_9EUKA|nr:hypothetical protein Ctob_005808 [Chrysochromulina tobinii]|eukprot:KOO31730.1 hypothetical protein Ctob_005808 [Chrysochromulina sp. CCMP291]